GPRSRPLELPRGEPGRVDAHDHVVFGGVRVRDVRQREPGGAGGAVSDGYGLHDGQAFTRPDQPQRPPSGTPVVSPYATEPKEQCAVTTFQLRAGRPYLVQGDAPTGGR